ncbi:MAG: hypothetical protein LAT84_14405, partial [Balneolia bacterium]|nr:hypothetical protein [Balneolia bacterium]
GIEISQWTPEASQRFFVRNKPVKLLFIANYRRNKQRLQIGAISSKQTLTEPESCFFIKLPQWLTMFYTN